MKEATFHEIRIGSTWLMVDAQFEKPVLELGPAHFLDPPAIGAGGAHGRAPTHVVSLAGCTEQLHVRRALHGGILARFWRSQLLGIGRARRELHCTAILRERGAPVPRPVLAVGRRSGIFWQVAVATVHEPGACDALAFLEANPAEERVRAAALAAGRAICRFHDLGGHHRDLHLKNLLIREHRDHSEVLVIDLDRCWFARPAGRRRRRRELARLRRSLHKRNLLGRVGHRACSTFINAYGPERLQIRNEE